MATVDLSRFGTDFRKRYAGVRMQQGRVLTDDDFNDAQILDEEDMRRTRVDVIGPFGSPDGGFMVVPPAAPLAPGAPVAFSLAPGTLYLGGLRLEEPAAEPFDLQKDWLNFDPAVDAPLVPGAGSRIDMVWIEAWQQEVAAEEDSEKFEAALGSADTDMNVRTLRRIAVRTNVGTDDCAAAWAAALAAWAPAMGTMAADMEIKTKAQLQVTYVPPPAPADLCTPPVAGGYLGAENQAIRVQLVDATHYTWGFNNAAPLYRVQAKTIIRGGVPVQQIVLLSEPKDAVHWPLKDQIVEILPWSAALPNGETLAELSGQLARVTATYNPDDQTLEIDTALPAGFGAQWKGRADKADFFDGTPADDYFFLRVWDRGDDAASLPAIPIASGTLGNTGLNVAFINGPLRPTDYWIIGARPATPDQVVPWQLEAVNGAPPLGVKRYRAPLGLIQWTVAAGVVTGTLVHDCRIPFLPLTRLRGCCTVTVGDGTTSWGMFASIQAAIAALPSAGGTVCVLPGTYNENVVIKNRRGIVVHGCDARARVVARTPVAGAEPAFFIVDSQEIAIERLGIEAGPRSAVEILRGERIAIRQCVIQMRDVPTIYQSIFARGRHLVIERNLVDVLGRGAAGIAVGVGSGALKSAFDGVSPPPPVVIAVATRGGIQLGGGCEDVLVAGNVIRGGIWNGITLGSLLVIGGGNDDVPDKPGTLDWCNPCQPVDTTDGDDPNDEVRVRSAGDLYDITIRDNSIEDMGANGISVVRFFNIAKTPILVSVHGLHILHNGIRRCMRRDASAPPASMQWLVGYGGISLAVVFDLRVNDNAIEHNGASHLDPICGVFAIAVQNLELDRNRIVDNGVRKGEEPASSAKPGTRGGVWIWFVIPNGTPRRVQDLDVQRSDGIPAAAIRDNVIAVPLGRTITMLGLGPMTLARNRLMTQGTTGRDLEVLATTVLIVNFGLSNELTLGLLFALATMAGGAAAGGGRRCELSLALGLVNPTTGRRWPPFSVTWPTGKLLVTENQVTCDTVDQPQRLALSSMFVASLDDVGFLDNQCEVESVDFRFLVNVLAVAGSVRMNDNRLSETWLRAFLSGWSIGVLNITAHNESTHCMRADAWPGQRVFKDNLHLVTAFCDDMCRQFQ